MRELLTMTDIKVQSNGDKVKMIIQLNWLWFWLIPDVVWLYYPLFTTPLLRRMSTFYTKVFNMTESSWVKISIQDIQIYVTTSTSFRSEGS